MRRRLAGIAGGRLGEPEQWITAVNHFFEVAEPEVSLLLGPGAAHGLLLASLLRVSSEHPVLSQTLMERGPPLTFNALEGFAGQDADEVAEAVTGLLADVVRSLVGVVGAPETRRLLRKVWRTSREVEKMGSALMAGALREELAGDDGRGAHRTLSRIETRILVALLRRGEVPEADLGPEVGENAKAIRGAVERLTRANLITTAGTERQRAIRLVSRRL